MTRFRQSILAFAIALALLAPAAGVASADPIDPGTTYSSSSTGPGRGNANGRPGASTTSDPIDPGTTY